MKRQNTLFWRMRDLNIVMGEIVREELTGCVPMWEQKHRAKNKRASRKY